LAHDRRESNGPAMNSDAARYGPVALAHLIPSIHQLTMPPQYAASAIPPNAMERASTATYPGPWDWNVSARVTRAIEGGRGEEAGEALGLERLSDCGEGRRHHGANKESESESRPEGPRSTTVVRLSRATRLSLASLQLSAKRPRQRLGMFRQSVQTKVSLNGSVRDWRTSTWP
jgi:hypothetical protein